MEEQTKIELYQAAAEMLEAEGWESSVQEAYSGRGMYGTTCPAIVTEASGVLLGMALGLAMEELGLSVGDPFGALPQRQDNMGRTAMVYY